MVLKVVLKSQDSRNETDSSYSTLTTKKNMQRNYVIDINVS